MSVFYNAVSDEIYLKHGRRVELGHYLFNGQIIPNHLGLIFWRINLKNWNRALKIGLLVKIGKL